MVVHAEERWRARYLVINADETEPGTCKDREISGTTRTSLSKARSSHSFAIRAEACYIYVRGEFIRERERLQAAIDEAYAARLIGKNNIHGWDVEMLRRTTARRLHLRGRDRAA